MTCYTTEGLLGCRDSTGCVPSWILLVISGFLRPGSSAVPSPRVDLFWRILFRFLGFPLPLMTYIKGFSWISVVLSLSLNPGMKCELWQKLFALSVGTSPTYDALRFGRGVGGTGIFGPNESQEETGIFGLEPKSLQRKKVRWCPSSSLTLVSPVSRTSPTGRFRTEPSWRARVPVLLAGEDSFSFGS